MPSGKIHDRITLWSLPVVTGATLALTRSSDLTLIVSGGYLFSGLMFSPDLDLHSRPFKRWGWLRWIWLPYQKVMRHRSIFSHGFLIGTTLRVLYLLVWIVGLGVVGLAVFELFQDVSWSWQQFAQYLERSLVEYQKEWLTLFLGLELGAMIHSVSDSLGSSYKRFKRRGVKGLFSQKPKRKSTRRITKRRNTKN